MEPASLHPTTSIQDGREGHGPADFDTTFREHYEPMVRSLAVACGDREVAADAVQDAYTRAFVRWRRIARYDDPAGWIRHVALNRLRDHFRRAERGRRAVDRLGGQTPRTVDAPDLPREAVPGLAEALAALPKQQRIAASLFYVEQLSVLEVATSMGLSEGAVKYHLHAARASLRETVEAP
jgi:RNA polymerase sigma-70 factor (ECF subfamily)